jgi:hypothetical protein
MNKMDRQQIFNKAIKGILDQGGPSVTLNMSTGKLTSCRYRGPDGTKCAIGHLIDDEEYDPSMEGYSVTGEQFFKWQNKIEKMAELEPSFLADLQAIHDNAVTSTLWKQEKFIAQFKLNARKFASSYNLRLEFR